MGIDKQSFCLVMISSAAPAPIEMESEIFRKNRRQWRCGCSEQSATLEAVLGVLNRLGLLQDLSRKNTNIRIYTFLCRRKCAGSTGSSWNSYSLSADSDIDNRHEINDVYHQQPRKKEIHSTAAIQASTNLRTKTVMISSSTWFVVISFFDFLRVTNFAIN